MGNEAYILYLRSAGAGVAETSTLLHQLGFADDPDAHGVTPPELAFVRTDPLHLIEGLLSEGSALHISLRFALCHPSMIDDVFARVHRTGAQLGVTFYADGDAPGMGQAPSGSVERQH